MAAKRDPREKRALELLEKGLGRAEVAEKVGTTPNHVWAISALAAGVVTEKQLAIARAIVERKRRISPPLAATPVAPKRTKNRSKK